MPGKNHSDRQCPQCHGAVRPIPPPKPGWALQRCGNCGAPTGQREPGVCSYLVVEFALDPEHRVYRTEAPAFGAGYQLQTEWGVPDGLDLDEFKAFAEERLPRGMHVHCRYRPCVVPYTVPKA